MRVTFLSISFQCCSTQSQPLISGDARQRAILRKDFPARVFPQYGEYKTRLKRSGLQRNRKFTAILIRIIQLTVTTDTSSFA